MENQNVEPAGHEQACARVAARFPQRWLGGYVRGKLCQDPIYPAAWELLSSSGERILDVGCGIGLLAFYLRERGCRQPVLGLDLDARKVRHGSKTAADCYENVELRCQDVQGAMPDFSGNIALFDVLHYLSRAKQKKLLSHLAGCVAPGGLLIIRDCPSDGGPRFWLTWLAEKFAQMVSWNLNTPLCFPSRASIDENFNAADFNRETRPLWGKSPFNNHIFIFRRR